MVGVPKDIALKMVIKSNCLAKDLYQLLQTSISDWFHKNSKNGEKLQ